MPTTPWWRSGVIYQIYPRSFADSDGDGVGDLRGATARLEYVRDLGAALLEHLSRSTTRRMLVGTWAAAEWAIRFYRGHGFEPVGPQATAALLKAYWTIPERQVEESVVLANPPLEQAPGAA